MKQKTFILILLAVGISLSATEFDLQGQWQEIKFDQVNHETGEVEYEEADQYIFLDEWVRIVEEDARHEVPFCYDY